MESAAPPYLAEAYDNAGLLTGRRDGSVTRILTALDLSLEVLKEAKEKKCEMVLMHHPIMFKPIRRVTDETDEGRCILFAIENNIAIYAAHTNLDFAEDGLNDFFLKKLGLKALGTISETAGRLAEVNMTGKELCGKIAEAFKLPVIRTTLCGDEVIKQIAVCTGSGKSLIDDVCGKADVYITGEVGHHDVLRLKEQGSGYIEISHYDSEIMVKELLRTKLTERFKDKIEVFESEKNVNPMRTIIF